jgi:hypothetical protein
MQEIKKNITIPRYQGNYFCYKGKIIILLYQSKYDESIALVKKKKKKTSNNNFTIQKQGPSWQILPIYHI